MATIIKHEAKDGKITYKIRVFAGRGVDGKQRKYTRTWTPPAGLTPKKIEKQLQIEAINFEEEVAAGISQDGNIKFEAFAEKFMKEYAQRNLTIKTVSGYSKMLPAINQAIGHIKLRDLKTGHLNTFYSNLQENGIRRDGKYKAKVNLKKLLKEKGFTLDVFSETSGIPRRSVDSVVSGANLDAKTANAVVKALGFATRSDLFDTVDKSSTLSSNTIHHYHALISSILTKAVKWGYIPYNPANNAELPKMVHKEADYLDEADARKLLTSLQQEPIKYRAAITFDLLSGLRKGELLGLRWRDVDFDTQTITIVQTSCYAPGTGLYIDTPKNETSARILKLSPSAFAMLREYRIWQDHQKELCGDYWKNTDNRIFTGDDGTPIHPETLSGWFRKFRDRNGFPGIHIHSLRHTYASLMIADEIPLVVVSRRLGHAQVSTTANIYAHVIASADEKAAQVAEKFADIITPTAPANITSIA